MESGAADRPSDDPRVRRGDGRRQCRQRGVLPCRVLAAVGVAGAAAVRGGHGRPRGSERVCAGVLRRRGSCGGEPAGDAAARGGSGARRVARVDGGVGEVARAARRRRVVRAGRGPARARAAGGVGRARGAPRAGRPALSRDSHGGRQRGKRVSRAGVRTCRPQLVPARVWSRAVRDAGGELGNIGGGGRGSRGKRGKRGGAAERELDACSGAGQAAAGVCGTQQRRGGTGRERAGLQRGRGRCGAERAAVRHCWLQSVDAARNGLVKRAAPHERGGISGGGRRRRLQQRVQRGRGRLSPALWRDSWGVAESAGSGEGLRGVRGAAQHAGQDASGGKRAVVRADGARAARRDNAARTCGVAGDPAQVRQRGAVRGRAAARGARFADARTRAWGRREFTFGGRKCRMRCS